MENLMEQVNSLAQAYGFKLLGALAILFFGRIVAGMLTSLVRKLMTRGGVDETLTKFVARFTRILLMTFVILAALSALEIETTSFIAVLGAAGLAVGFALQNSLGNFASGVMLIMFHPFKTGDFVEAGGTSGIVEEISVFTTVLKTVDNKKVIVPNGQITGGTITNFSAHETRRIDLVFGIGYNDDIKLAKETLERIIRDDDRVLDDPEPTVVVLELADSSVNFAVRPWVKSADFWATRCDIIEKVKLTFDEKGISIPFPQQDVHVHQVAAA